MLQDWDVLMFCGDQKMRRVRITSNTIEMAMQVAIYKLAELYPKPFRPMGVKPVMQGED